MTRDNVNQHGYACPTEAQAIYNADRKPEPPRKRSPSVMYEEDIKAMDKPRKAQSLAAFMEAEPEEYKQGAKTGTGVKGDDCCDGRASGVRVHDAIHPQRQAHGKNIRTRGAVSMKPILGFLTEAEERGFLTVESEHRGMQYIFDPERRGGDIGRAP